MSEEQNIPGDQNSNNEAGKKHFPEDSHAPKSAGSPEPGADSHESSLVQSSIANSPSPGSGLQTDTMEVHKHPHHPAHRKKWGEYLLEFLMLFLAVFLGFIAENIREHYVEHKREKQYAGQLLSDLRKDSAFFSERGKRIEKTFAKSWVKELFSQQQHPGDPEIIRGFLNEFWSFDVSLTNTTFIQMKTSGSLRYIRNAALTSELQKYYDVLSARVVNQSAVSANFLNDYMLPWYVNHIRAQDIDGLGDTILNHNTVIINRTEKTDQEVLNITDTYRLIILTIHETQYQPAARQADTLIAMIKREYHLE